MPWSPAENTAKSKDLRSVLAPYLGDGVLHLSGVSVCLTYKMGHSTSQVCYVNGIKVK